MDVKVLEMTEHSARLMISGVDPPVANAIRRALINDVPKMAVEDVEFHMGSIIDEEGKEYESAAPLFDEMIAHRLGLIPLPTNLETFMFQEDCTCKGEGCPTCTIMYSLNKKGPCTVYSGDLEPLGDKSLSVMDDLIPIVKLNKDQALLIYATAVLGTGKQHAKWQACHGVGYHYNIELEFTEEAHRYAEDLLERIPGSLLKKKGKELIPCDKDPKTLMLIHNYAEAVVPGAVKIVGDPTTVVFKFETDKSVTAKEALTKAFEALEHQLDDFKEAVSSLK